MKSDNPDCTCFSNLFIGSQPRKQFDATNEQHRGFWSHFKNRTRTISEHLLLIKKQNLYFLTYQFLLLTLITSNLHAEETVEYYLEFFNERKQQAVRYMEIRTLFPDEGIRRLAYYAGIGDLENAQKWIDKGVDVNSLGKNNGTPLLWSLMKGNIDGFSFLLKKRANPNVVTLISDKLLRRRDAYSTSVLHFATYYGLRPFLVEALAHGGNPNLKNMHGDPPLAYAGCYSPDIIKILLENGALVNFHPMHVEKLNPFSMVNCMRRQTYEAAFILLENGANYDDQDDMGKSALDYLKMAPPTYSIKNLSKREALKNIKRWFADRGIKIR